MIIDTLTLSAIVIAITEALKRGLAIPSKFQPLLAIALAVGLGGTAGFWGWTDLTLGDALLAGLTACGLWSSTKATLGK